MKIPINVLVLSLAISFLIGNRNDDEAIYTIPEGFELEEIYSPSENEHGTWVAIEEIRAGVFVTADQHGRLYQVDLNTNPDEAQVSKIALNIGKAQGLLWAFDALYIVVNSDEGVSGNNSGLYRARDSDSDGTLDHLEPLKHFEGSGEHGPHSIVLGPDGESLYLVAGNHTELPEGYSSNNFSGKWDNDNLFPAILDPRGHAVHTKAPGGWIGKTDKEGKDWEIFSVGFRNTYDIGFNSLGDLFAFDSDMEWDMGMPWYRPTRVLHVTKGSEFGWRPGSQKWPEYFPDNLPSVITLNQGSPTGLLFAYQSKFPKEYQESLFVLDWSFGTIYRLEMENQGSSYSARASEFISGKPFPVTDAIIGKDGSMYILTGGRKLDSKMFRLRYSGDEDNGAAQLKTEPNETTLLRRQVEDFMSKGEDKSSLYIELLNHKDRHVRFAARQALEKVPSQNWSHKHYQIQGPRAVSEFVIALSRTADLENKEIVFETLLKQDLGQFDDLDKLAFIRASSLAFQKLGTPFPQLTENIKNKLFDLLPSNNTSIDREVVALLSFLNDERVIEMALSRLEESNEQDLFSNALLDTTVTSRRERYGSNIEKIRDNPPSATQISYAYSLSHLEGDWTQDQRQRFFSWFYQSMQKTGGNSYKGFIDEIRQRTLSRMSPKEREQIQQISSDIESLSLSVLQDLPVPQGPGKNWNAGEIGKDLDERLEHRRDYNRGKRMYQAALCESCHVLGDKGGLIGPSLNQVSGKFGKSDLIRSITLPSESITDQYAGSVIYMKGQDITMGRIVNESDTWIRVNTNPFDQDQFIEIDSDDIESIEESPISLMPPGLLDRLNLEEVTDLLAYLLSDGNPDHQFYSDSTAVEN